MLPVVGQGLHGDACPAAGRGRRRVQCRGLPVVQTRQLAVSFDQRGTVDVVVAAVPRVDAVAIPTGPVFTGAAGGEAGPVPRFEAVPPAIVVDGFGCIPVGVAEGCELFGVV